MPFLLHCMQFRGRLKACVMMAGSWVKTWPQLISRPGSIPKCRCSIVDTHGSNFLFPCFGVRHLTSLDQVMSQQPIFKQRVEPQTVTPELLCRFPVMVYQCPVGGECEPNPQLAMFERARTEGSGVFCWGVLGFYMWDTHPCADHIWNCTDGMCSGYQKSERLCAAKLHRQGYACFFDPDNPGVGVQEDRYTSSTALGVVCFVFLVLTSVCSCLLCYFATSAFYQRFHSLSDFARHLRQFTFRGCCCSHTARLVYGIIAGVSVVSLELVVFLLLLPGQSYYSFWGAPQLAASWSEISSFGRQIRDF